LSDMPPSDRYLVGMLAPRRTPAAVDASRAEAGEPAIGGDDAPLDAPAARPALHPSSKGISFAVAAGVESVTVTCTWGRYHREEVAAAEPAAVAPPSVAGGDAATQPTLPASGPAPAAAVGSGTVRVWRGPAGAPGVHLSLRLVRRDDAALVSLFLVNDQDPVMRAKDSAWMFQAEFAVASGGAPVFLGRDRLLNVRRVTGSELERAELNQLDMMYRRHVEFAVGHGTGVHWETAPGDPTRAWKLATRSVPRYEVALTEPPRPGEPGFDGLDETVLDMRELSLASDQDLPGMLAPLVSGYRSWLARQSARIGAEPDLAPHTEAAEIAVDQAGGADRRPAGGQPAAAA
ncbi:MAG: hypothetical protein WCF04_00590, partial [Candidatus Nanopelagicales bacterium]